MATPPNKLSQFWQELKRRNVVRVVTVYAGAAFVIIELINNITEPLKLPEWTPTLVIVLLAVGFPVVIIFSWIYDVDPEGGVVKTEPADKIKPKVTSKSSISWKFASYISFAVIVGLIVLNIIPRTGKNAILDKSIAVLPFINDSPEEEGMHFINGTMESILDNLCKINDLRVVSRTSVEQYRNNLKPVQEIGKEMKVAYVLEGSGLKHGDRIRLTLQLIDAAHDRHVWSQSYDRSEEEVFELFSEVSQLVAKEINAVITPEEKERIEKTPTSSQTALELFQRAMTEPDDKAIELLNYALEFDSTFSWPYDALARIYLRKYNQNPGAFDHLMDSVAKLTNKALHIDPLLASALSTKGHVYRYEGKLEEAVSSFEKAIYLNPNMVESYNALGWFYFDRLDYVNAIENFHKSMLRDRTPDHMRHLNELTGFVFSILGFGDIAQEYLNEYLNWHGDTAWYLQRQAQVEQYAGNYDRAIELAQIGYEKNPEIIYSLVILGESYQFLGQDEQSFSFFSTYVDIMDRNNGDILWHKIPIACSYLKNGYVEKAESLIEQQIKQAEEWIGSKRVGFEERYWYLAMAYALKGDHYRVNEYLNKFLSFRTGIHILFLRQLHGPIFYGMKDDTEFMEICDTFNARYQATHEQVRQWLVENDVL
jgi:TolB-like protein/Tfp pilus assembly protein PilF